MTRFETRVEIARDRDEVFHYVADPARFAAWNSAVESVAPVADARYLMRRQLPAGWATNELVIDATPPDHLTIRTTTGPTPFVYRYTFEPTDAGTLIVLDAEVRLGGVATALGPLAAASVKRGVDANFTALRAILEHDG
jgi:carbon monoxide dehydrogenase subunit G